VDIHARIVLCDRDVVLHGLQDDGGAAGDINGNIPNDEMSLEVDQVMEHSEKGPAVLILDSILVSWAALSPRKMAVVPRSQLELWW